MTTTQQSLRVTELEFSQIKQNLKNFLSGKPEFADFDFTGSAINLLLDLLAYATHYNAVYANFSINEMFLDTAQQMSGVISRAKEMNYLPSSKTAAFAILQLNFTVTGSPEFYTIPKGTIFTATASDGTTFPFVNPHDCSVQINSHGNYSVALQVFQGIQAAYSYTVNNSDSSQRFIIPSNNADIRFLDVEIQTDANTDDASVWTRFDGTKLGDYDGESQVFFLEQTYDGYYRINFGNGTIGAALSNSNLITLNYLITSGDAANGLNSFTVTSGLSGVTSITATTVAPSQAGAQAESIDSIKFNAPLASQAQNRAVTNIDFVVLLKNNFPNITDAVAWSGVDNIPPAYGKIFAAITSGDGQTFSTTEKQNIQTFMQNNYNLASVRPVIVDPEFLNVSLDVTCTYNARTLGSENLNTTINTAISAFFESNLNQFSKALYFSKLLGAIDNSSQNILNTIINLKLHRSLPIFAGNAASYEFDFNNSISVGSVQSNLFLINGTQYQITDIPTAGTTTGVLAISNTTGNTTTYLTKNTGTVDYNAGTVFINSLKIDSILNDPLNNLLEISVGQGQLVDLSNPQNPFIDMNVYTNGREQIISLEPNGISITLIADNTA